MEDVTVFHVNECGEVRVGIDREFCDGPYVSLAMNHFEDDTEWGAQPLTPKEAMEVGKALIGYAARAEMERNNQKVDL